MQATQRRRDADHRPSGARWRMLEPMTNAPERPSWTCVQARLRVRRCRLLWVWRKWAALPR